MLRHSEQAAPLPGSPFTVRVLPGAAHGPSTRLNPREIPLRGVFELVTEEGTLTSTARCYCKMVLHSCDKMGNPCSNGGSVVTCGVTNSSLFAASKTSMDAQTTEVRSLVVESKTTDQGDGTYLLEWWSVSSGSYEIYIKIDGLHVLGSPTYMLLTSGTPDIAKTEVISFPQRADAGKPCKTRLKCKDQYKNPALPGRDLRFGLATVPSSEKDPLAWKQAKVTVLAHTIIGEELELRFTCLQAGDFKVPRHERRNLCRRPTVLQQTWMRLTIQPPHPLCFRTQSRRPNRPNRRYLAIQMPHALYCQAARSPCQ